MSALLLKTSDVGRTGDPFQSHFSSLERVGKGKFGNVSKLCLGSQFDLYLGTFVQTTGFDLHLGANRHPGNPV